MKEEGSSSTKRSRFPFLFSGDEETDNITPFGMLFDLDLLTCPVCSKELSVPIFQCPNGHLTCSSCCPKPKEKCASCTLPIGVFRCKAMEKMVQSLVFLCPNFKYGCKEFLFSEDQKTHERKCLVLQCSCPLQSCNYKGKYKDLFQHFDAIHRETWTVLCSYDMQPITIGNPCVVSMSLNKNINVLMETNDSLLFVIQCFGEPHGVCVTLNCIAPFSSEVGEFSYSLSSTYNGHVLKSEFMNLKKVQELSFETPREDFLVIPSYYRRTNNASLKVTVVINKKKME